MASQTSLCFLVVLFAGFLIGWMEAYQFNVGGKQGWVLNPSESYDQWAQRMRFQVNDTLFFKYNKGSDSVLVVSKEDYDTCNTQKPITKMDGGDSVFKFDRSGPFYFISGNKTNCDKGQKLTVVVLAVRNNNKPNSPPPSPPAGAPAPTMSPKSPSSTPSQSPLAQPPGAGAPAPAMSPQFPSPTPSNPSPSPEAQPPSAGSPASAPTPSMSPAPATSPVSPSPTASPPTSAASPPSPTTPSPTAVTVPPPGGAPANENAPAPPRSSAPASTPSVVFMSLVTLVLAVSLGSIF